MERSVVLLMLGHHGRQAKLLQIGMGTMGCVELVVEKLLGSHLGAEWFREKVDGWDLVS